MQKKKGISLIVLVITIIVMIILAAAIILTLNNSGIINKANEAVEVTDLAQVKNLAALKWAEAYLNETITDKAAYVESELQNDGINVDDYEITVTDSGVDVAVKVKVPTEWKENVTAIVDGVPILKGFVASSATGENTKAGGLVIYEGTEAVTDANVETARRTRNQYVWVPVSSEDFTTKFVRQKFGMNYTIANAISNTLGTDYWEAVLDLTTNMPLTEQSSEYITSTTLTEVQAMYASVKEYEGFFIARYEAGIDAQRTANNYLDEEGNLTFASNVYSMMGKVPYEYIPWTESNMSIADDTNGAVQVARSIYPVTNTEYGVVSTLTYGVQWDTVLQWWLDTNSVTSVTDSTNYGNHLDHVINSADDLNDDALVLVFSGSDSDTYISKDDVSIKYPKSSGTQWSLSTGALKAANVNNIYDMAGNVMEWTMEGGLTYTRIPRGGACNDFADSKSYRPVAYRFDGDPYIAWSLLRFSTIPLHKTIIKFISWATKISLKAKNNCVIKFYLEITQLFLCTNLVK